MDPSEARSHIQSSDQELQPLYESVNSKDSEEKPSRCLQINRTLLPFKAFYYFFYGAIASLLPFIPLYFKHLWLSPTQVGLLVGLRPITQSITTVFWAFVADRFNAKKTVLFIGLCGWMFAYISLLLVPAAKKPLSCMVNSTHMLKRSVDFSYPLPKNILGKEHNPYPQDIHDYNPVDIIYASHNDTASKQRNQNPPDSLSYNSAASAMLLEQEDLADQERFSPNISSSQNSLNIFSEIKTKAGFQPNLTVIDESNLNSTNNEDGKESWWSINSMHGFFGTWHTFTYLFLIILIGNLFAAPAQTMANTATLQVLGDDTYKYGEQRCFGSIGWGVSAFVVGMLVSMNHDSSLACKGIDDINYSPCFYAFGFLMLCALVVAIPFKYRNANEVKSLENRAHLAQVCQQLDCLTLIVFFIVLLAGFNMGFIQNFLFLYLQSLGGSQTLFSLILGFNAVGELIGFLFSVKLISKYGHLKMLALGIFAYAVRLTVYGVVENPWLVLTVEFLKAFTFSVVWAAALSFICDSCQNGSTLAAFVHMLFWGVGYGGGGIIGGVLMERIGGRTTFLGLAVISLSVVMLIFVVIQLDCCQRRLQDIDKPVESDDSDE